MRLRSVLFAPACRPDLVGKLPRSAPDVAVVDLEDSVPAEAKAAARESLAQLVRDLRRDAPDLPVFVRVNAPGTPFHDDDLESLTSDVMGVAVPKVARFLHAELVDATLHRRGLGGVPLLLGIETVAGVVAVAETVAAPRVVAAYFGAEDYVTDLGGVRTEGGLEVLYARSRVAMAARLAGVAAVDQVVTTLRDETRFMADAAAGRALGYSGKLCIHPAQVAWANRAFSPDAAEVDRAERLLAAFEAATARGEAAIAFDGEMVDEPLARRARAVLDAQDEG